MKTPSFSIIGAIALTSLGLFFSTTTASAQGGGRGMKQGGHGSSGHSSSSSCHGSSGHSPKGSSSGGHNSGGCYNPCGNSSGHQPGHNSGGHKPSGSQKPKRGQGRPM